MNRRIILGIDPGNARCGYAVLAYEGGHLSLLECGCIITPKTMNASDRLCCVYNDTRDLLKRHRPTEMAIESLYFCRNVTSAMAVSEARGVLILAAAQDRVPVYQYTPMQVKQIMTGSGRANKEQVCLTVMMTLGLTEKPTPDDTADAIAIALSHAWHVGTSSQGNVY